MVWGICFTFGHLDLGLEAFTRTRKMSSLLPWPMAGQREPDSHREPHHHVGDAGPLFS